jgi:tetratricopeptide (TPR) repeat protein
MKIYFWQDNCYYTKKENKTKIMNTFKIIAITLLMSNVSFGQTLKDAVKKTENEEFSKAASEFKSLIALEPANGCNYFYYGENFYESGELDSAIMMWNKAAVVDPITALSYVGQGKALWMKGDQAGGKAQFTKALAMTKNKNPEIMRAIAETYIVAPTKSLDEAILLLESAIKLDARNEDAHLLMGDALLEKTPAIGGPSIKSYNKVLEINPKSPRGIVRTAILYQRAQNYELANEKYKEAQTIDPTYAPAYRLNAELNMYFGQSTKAIENWKKYLALNNSIESRYRYVTAMFNGKQFCEVIPEIEALKNDGFNNFYMERMLTYAYTDCSTDPESAKKGLAASDRFFAIVPAEKVLPVDYKYKGLLLSKAGNDSLAIIELEKASSLDPEAAKELASDIGRMYLKMKKYDKVIAIYTFKMSVSKLTPEEHFNMGRAYYVGPKNYILADSSFARVIAISPTYTPAYLWRARSNSQQDLKNEKWLAKPYYEKVLELVKAEERAVGPNKNMVMESAKYMGDYYVSSTAKDLAKAKEAWTIVRDLDPADKQAKAFFDEHK